MTKYWLFLLVSLSVLSYAVSSQVLPNTLKSYLDRNYRGWKLAGECYPTDSENKRFISGDFDGNGRRDYAVKFVRGKRGFFMAFLENRRKWKPFYLHIWKDANEARFSDLMLMEKGEGYPEGTPRRKFDSPADFRCESDVGGVHTYRNGKFIAY